MRKSFIFILSVMTFCSVAAQTEPKVTTNPKYARGATMAFGRMTATAASSTNSITEKGFCWATHVNPTVDENKTTKQMSAGSGSVYVLENLEPATLYYMRAYAIAKDGSVGYGDEIKFSTLPKGEVTFWYNNGGDDAANKRINDAATKACDIFSNLTSMKKKFNIGYSSGTPTADCYYGDEPWMNMGANSSYQRTGTIMHEMQHGFGVIPYTTQWSGDILRSGSGTGYWLGERVSAFLDFWDNKTGSQLNGDTQHMWPYGINGASEDDGSLKTYYANAMIGQALGEDGLEHRSNTFAEPCYIFVQDDDVKYYLKNEDPERGLYSAYLMPDKTGTLKWQELSSAEAMLNDSAAWYITFTPKNQYYQLRNASTGQYMTYSSAFKTITRTTAPTSNENFHLMKGRVDVGSGSNAKRGYWLIHPTGTMTPNCLFAKENGATGSQTFDIKNSATTQRWLILTADELAVFEEAAMTQLKTKIASTLKPIKALAEVPHSTSPEDASQTFTDALNDIEQRMENATTVAELSPLESEAVKAAYDFLSVATPTKLDTPFDLTYLIQDAGIDTGDGWSTAPAINYSCGEFYEKSFNMNQILYNMPKGTYRLSMQGFQRPGSYADAYKDYTKGENKVNAWLFAGGKSTKIAHIVDCAQTKKLGGTEASVATNLYVPDNMLAASKYFAKGLYENSVVNQLTTSSMGIGLRCQTMSSKYWCIFDNFRLHFFGSISPDIVLGIKDVDNASALPAQNAVYALDGRKLNTGKEQLKPGLYIINGRKTIIR